MEISYYERFKLGLKRVTSYFCLLLVVLLLMPYLFWVMRYRIRHLVEVRKQFAKLTADRHQRPILLCLNHLTRIDSVILACAVLPVWQAFFKYSLVVWHVLDLANLPILSSVLKTLPIVRMGDRKKIRLMQAKVKYLLKAGDLVVIFPEGTRSVTGRVDTRDFQYGVGDILRNLPECRVLCVYLRGDKQMIRSNVPPKNSVIDITFKLIHPTSQLEGLRASRELAAQVVHTLDQMENKYFAAKIVDRK